MRVVGARGRLWYRLLREERGFTLPEMLVTMVVMIVVLFALYNIFDTSIRVFRFGNDKTEAMENARLGLERMEREIRGAYRVDRANNRDYLFFTASDATKTNSTPSNAPPQAMPAATQITFGNDLGTGNGKIECPNTANCEYITYKLSQSGGTRTLLRNRSITGSLPNSGGEPVVEYINGAKGLNFTYLGSNGDPCGSSNPTCSGADEGQIQGVRITLDIRVEGGANDGTQTLTTDVDLRNREGQR